MQLFTNNEIIVRFPSLFTFPLFPSLFHPLPPTTMHHGRMLHLLSFSSLNRIVNFLKAYTVNLEIWNFHSWFFEHTLKRKRKNGKKQLLINANKKHLIIRLEMHSETQNSFWQKLFYLSFTDFSQGFFQGFSLKKIGFFRVIWQLRSATSAGVGHFYEVEALAFAFKKSTNWQHEFRHP